MLTRLAVSNFATIESLAIEFHPGFTVLTGETGAGKSILIGALRLVLGAPAAQDQVRAGATQTSVEACFDLAHLPQVREQLTELGIPVERELVLRRTLHASGRSRALANDCAVTQAKLEDIGAFLVNIHGQHDHQQLLDRRTHLAFLDAFAGLDGQREAVREAHGQHAAVLKALRELEVRAVQQEALRQGLQETIAALETADLHAGEEETVRQSLHALSHAEELLRLIDGAAQLLSEGDASLLNQLSRLAQVLNEAAGLDPAIAPILAQLLPLQIQIDDAYRTVRDYGARLDAEPQRLEQLQARLAQLERIKRLHGGSITAALARLDSARRELGALEGIADAVAEQRAEAAKLATSLHGLAVDLSRRRRAAAQRFDEEIVRQLNELGMNKARFQTQMETADASPQDVSAIHADGKERVEFLLSTNPGHPPLPLARIASGGELSRTMLALKTVLADVDPTRTLVFDEVDAGISGAVAEIVGRKLRALGRGRQVLCITHLPQIAAQGQQHLRVAKATQGGQTFTTLIPLEGQDKVQEVARLLSGVTVTANTLASAEEMVNRGNRASG
ncbi:MAG: DNA repair protein RecN [SAR324 cluster bacterium]